MWPIYRSPFKKQRHKPEDMSENVKERRQLRGMEEQMQRFSLSIREWKIKATGKSLTAARDVIPPYLSVSRETRHLYPAVILWQVRKKLSQNLPTLPTEFPIHFFTKFQQEHCAILPPSLQAKNKTNTNNTSFGVSPSFASTSYASWCPKQKFVKMQMLP